MELIKLLLAGSTVVAAAEMVGVHGTPAAEFFLRLREVMMAGNLPGFELSGVIEADKSYFVGVRKGKRGRGAAGKVAVFGLLTGSGKVYTTIIPNAKATRLLPTIDEEATPVSIVYTDNFKGEEALDVGVFQHRRINH
ncbi:transposase, partial [Pelagicoccus sp. SDUM812002]|uniref:transposase n=1 Tax=Pelagicoccus sp. SDUM812002 TaxID=3041266 RepID=UPI00280C888F